MIVYRFEKNGIGPYVSGASPKVGSFFRTSTITRTEKVAKQFFNAQLLSTSVDRREAWHKAHSSKRYMFGCKSKKQLRAYFGGNFKDLFREGYRIKRYKVPDDKVIDMVVEVAFPVDFHKLQNTAKIKKLLTTT